MVLRIIPNFLIDHNIPAGVWKSGDVQTRLNKMLEDKYKVKGLC
jgi:hypothetical protein